MWFLYVYELIIHFDEALCWSWEYFFKDFIQFRFYVHGNKSVSVRDKKAEADLNKNKDLHSWYQHEHPQEITYINQLNLKDFSEPWKDEAYKKKNHIYSKQYRMYVSVWNYYVLYCKILLNKYFCDNFFAKHL